jgi:hypothetical protein
LIVAAKRGETAMTQNDIRPVEVGDLVKWKTKERPKIGVVLDIEKDGTCVIDITDKGVRRTEKISAKRLELIISTVKPAPEGGQTGNPTTELPFQAN